MIFDADARASSDILRRASNAFCRREFMSPGIRYGFEKGGASRLCRHRAVALEPEQQVGSAVATTGLPSKRPCSNVADSTRPRGKDLGSKGFQVGVVHCRKRQFDYRARSAYYKSSCCVPLRTLSTRSEISLRRSLMPPSSSWSLALAWIRSFAMFRAAITAIRSSPTMRPLSRISRIFSFRISAESSKSVRSSAGQATWYSLSRIRTLTCAICSVIRRSPSALLMYLSGSGSGTLFHRFQSADHCLDSGAHLLVFL